MSRLVCFVVALCVPFTLGQLGNSVNDLLTMKALDIDIPDVAYHSMFAGRGLVLGRQGRQAAFAQGNLGGLETVQLQPQLSVGGNINLGQAQQIGQIQQSAGNAISQQPLLDSNAHLGLNSISQQTQLGGIGNLGSQQALLGNTGVGISQQSQLGGIGNLGPQQALLGNTGLGGINQQSNLQGLSRSGAFGRSQLGSLRGSPQIQLGGNQLQGLSRSGAVRQGNTFAARLGVGNRGLQG